MKLSIFNDFNFLTALKMLFKELNVPINYVTDKPTTAKELLKDTYKSNESFTLINDVFFVGMVDDGAFNGTYNFEVNKIKSDYDGILIFGVTLKNRPNDLLPTRAQLAEIARAFNREFYYTPVVVIFKYLEYIAFANTERLKFTQVWRDGEKAGKVTLLRDINIKQPHSGHERILLELTIPTTGKDQIDNFAKLYTYWQNVFSVSLLNKKFYKELSDWYFWAVKLVTFPGVPSATDAHLKDAKLEDLIQEHKATNVIRMLTRLLFVWFIKEKKLIPEELFELTTLQKDILKDITPYHETGMFKQASLDSIYYKAILQNLFFASLNCPIKADTLDKRQRGFRGEGYGTHRGIDYLMRYKDYFRDPDKFLELVNSKVPFLNGGLFECLDEKYNNIYIDGFSDQMAKGEQLIVPDYLFFGVEEKVDLSKEYGINNKDTKEAAVKGLINILKSYKFTITENTPIEEDVALDPELLGKVFENLLASYNPETKTTARKLTGSFYTPRDIVNYMVDESLIAYLKKGISDWGVSDEKVNLNLHTLTSFDNVNPFENNLGVTKQIISLLDKCTILDPACGSGAFPMGCLQKMVHILQKLDPENKIWKEVQRQKTLSETEAAFEIEDRQDREDRLIEINNAFDQNINDPDYARKLFLIENCIYGVDIQPIATQISKLRFFISLVVDQKKNETSENFGIRPLPNLETKFVTANSLFEIQKPVSQLRLYDSDIVKSLEYELKKIRHKLFGAKSKETKLKYREKDEILRNSISIELEKTGWARDTAQKLAGWDPYEQNNSSNFFDPEWMFDINKGFDIIIGNPPYGAKFSIAEKKYIRENYLSMEGDFESYILFIERNIKLLSNGGVLNFIIPNNFLMQWFSGKIRKLILGKKILQIIDLGFDVFESAVVPTAILLLQNESAENNIVKFKNQENELFDGFYNVIQQKEFSLLPNNQFNLALTPTNLFLYHQLKIDTISLDDTAEVKIGIECKPEYITDAPLNKDYKPLVRGRNFERYLTYFETDPKYVLYKRELLHRPREERLFLTNEKILIRQTGDKIIAAIDTDKLYAWKSVFVVLVHNEALDIKYILALLNSLTLNYFYNIIVGETGRAFAQVKGVNLGQLPIKHVNSSRQALIALLTDFITFVKRNNKNNLRPIFENVLDAAILEIYFPDHLIKNQLSIIEFLEKDIQEANCDRFTDLELDQQKKVIEQLYFNWTHPNNEARNRIKLFAVRSPNILKPILDTAS